MSLEVISGNSASFKGSKNSESSEAFKGFKYLTSMRQKRNEFKLMTFAEYNKLSSKSLKSAFYEYITSDADGFHLFFDSDKASNIDEFNEFYNTLIEIQDIFGDFTMAGYTKDEELSNSYDLTLKPNSKKFVSVHVCYPKAIIPKNLYRMLTNPDFNGKYVKHSSEDNKDVDFGIIHNIDASIYSFLGKEQLMRSHLSNKEDSTNGFKLIDTKCSVIGGTNSDMLITLNGNEDRTITKEQLIESGLFEKKNDEKIRAVGRAPGLPGFLSTDDFDPELNLLKIILKNIYNEKGKERDYNLASKISGIVISACRERFDKEDLKELLHEWYNTDKEGNEVLRKNPNKCDIFVDSYYNKPTEKYNNAPADVYMKALKKLIPNEKTRKFISERIKETFSSITVGDNDDYHDFNKIKYHSEIEIQKCKTLDSKVNILAECVRYDPIRGIFYTYIQEKYALTDMRAEHFKLRYLPSIVGAEGSIKIYNSLLSLTALRGIPRIKITDIHRCNPMDLIEDESPETKESDIKLFEEFFEQIFKKAEPEVKEYLKKWIGVMIQNPGSIEVAIIILSGPHGTGKSLFCKLIAFLLYVKHTVNFSNQSEQYIDSPYSGYEDTLEDHTGKFNAKVAYRIFSAIQELNDNNENVSQASIIANLKRLTDPSKNIQKKGIDSVDSQNITQIMIGTNSKKPLPIEHTERRYLPIEINREHAKDRKFWGKFYKGFSAPFFIKHIYDYFKAIDIKDFAEENIPRTELLIKMMADSLSTVNKFVCINYDKCTGGLTYSEFLNICEQDKRLLGKYTSADNLWRDYINNYECEGNLEQVNKNGKVIKVKKFYPSEDILQDIDEIHEKFADMYYRGKFEKVDPFELDPTEEELSEVQQLEKNINDEIEKITKIQESQKGNYAYILNSDIRSDIKSSVVDKLKKDGWVEDKHLGNTKNKRGYKKMI